MTNKELYDKIKEIAFLENPIDQLEKINDFEKEYKSSDFYKKTKTPLEKVFILVKTEDLFSGREITKSLQNFISNADFSNLSNILNQAAEVYGTENTEVIKQISDLGKILNSNNNTNTK
jgi:hypothetical protein